MQKLQLYEFTQSQSRLRVCLIDGEPYFSLQDICCELNINNITKLRERLDQKGVKLKLTPTKGGLQNMFFINEKNVYKCIFKSKKQEAEKFQDWVFETVLPQIRKTGSYSVFQDNSLTKHINIKEQIKNSIEDQGHYQKFLPRILYPIGYLFPAFSR